MMKLSLEQVKELVRRMENNGADFIDIDVELDSDFCDNTWVNKISIDTCTKDGKYLDTVFDWCDEDN